MGSDRDDPVLFSCDPPVQPPGRKAQCDCFNFFGKKHSGLPILHAEQQHTTTDAWAAVLENIERAKRPGAFVRKPLAGLTGEQRAQIFTLPPSIGELAHIREVKLYGSHLVRLPPEIGLMASLRHLDVYTSYTLHFFPFELTRCEALTQFRVSTRAIYGNYKHRPPFPHLKSSRIGISCGSCLQRLRRSAQRSEAGAQMDHTWRWIRLDAPSRDCMLHGLHQASSKTA